MFKHLLVPTDGSALSQRAVARAVSFAREAGARITFFYAEPEAPAAYMGLGAIANPHMAQDLQARLDGAAKDILDAAMQQARAAGVDSQPVARTGNRPYELIIAAAQTHGCDLIFMASHGRRGVEALLLGSETQKVLTHLTVPVLVYR
jgi:nucleotide-binding universal stress UspA family protein